MSSESRQTEFKFSLWGLVVAITIAAVIIFLSMRLPATHWVLAKGTRVTIVPGSVEKNIGTGYDKTWVGELHPPTSLNIAVRIAIGLSALAAVFGTICFRLSNPKAKSFDLLKIKDADHAIPVEAVALTEFVARDRNPN
jgi:hypothetical protein